MELIKKAWRGEEKLWKVFWLLGLVVPFIFGILIRMLAFVSPLIGLLELLIIPYTIWWMIACWKCAWNSTSKTWGILARVYIVLSILVIPLLILIGGVLAGQDLIEAAKCRKAMTEIALSEGKDPGVYMMDHAEDKSRCLEVGIEGMGWKITPKQLNAPERSSEKSAAMPSASISQSPASVDSCEQQLIDNAKANNVDPTAYVAQNQAWLMQCRQSAPVAGAVQ
jgi:hypothetical protein